MLVAITRDVSPAITDCQLTFMQRQPISLPAAQKELDAYEGCLTALGCRVQRLPMLPDFPDSVFVEDEAIVVDEVGIITRPGAVSRRGETASMAAALAAYRRLETIREPGTIDGGDVLRCGKQLYIGSSRRTNREGIDQVRAILAPLGYSVQAVPVTGALHLKTAATFLAPDLVLRNPRWIDSAPLGGREFIDVDESEPFAGNGLLISDTLLFPDNFPKTRERLERRGIRVQTVDMTEFAKAEGSMTCCSVVFQVP